MKVCMLTTGHSALDDRIFFKEVRSLTRAGYTVSVVANRVPEQPEYDGVRLIGAPPPVRGPLGRWWSLLRAGLAERADVYHVHEPDALWVAAAIRCLRPQTRIVYDVHEWFPELRFRTRTRLSTLDRLRQRWLVWLDRRFSRSADAIITVDDRLAARYRSYGGGQVPVVILGHYPPLEIFPAVPPADDGRPVTFAYVGGISEDRGLTEMVQGVVAANKAGFPSRLQLHGAFMMPKDRQQFETLCQDPAVAACVMFAGWIAHDQIGEQLSHVDVGLSLLYPIQVYRECLPIKLFEYMACGRPVITSNLPMMQAIVDECACGLTVDVLDPTQVADAFIRLASDRALRHTLGAAGRAAAVDRYHWGTYEPDLLATYARLAAPRG
jgi:glycosyltransferase involved in cell wall biosynthesis